MKAPASTATIVTELEKWTIVRVLRSNLHWTLRDLLAFVDDQGVGGPRWKLQASLRRLVDAGQATRAGVTSATRYMGA